MASLQNRSGHRECALPARTVVSSATGLLVKMPVPQDRLPGSSATVKKTSMMPSNKLCPVTRLRHRITGPSAVCSTRYQVLVAVRSTRLVRGTGNRGVLGIATLARLVLLGQQQNPARSWGCCVVPTSSHKVSFRLCRPSFLASSNVFSASCVGVVLRRPSNVAALW